MRGNSAAGSADSGQGNFPGGCGGGSIWGGGGAPAGYNGFNGSTGTAGAGGGGGSAHSGNPGQNGGEGIIVVEEYA